MNQDEYAETLELAMDHIEQLQETLRTAKDIIENQAELISKLEAKIKDLEAAQITSWTPGKLSN
jgi:CHASE3 domain sensor protein